MRPTRPQRPHATKPASPTPTGGRHQSLAPPATAPDPQPRSAPCSPRPRPQHRRPRRRSAASCTAAPTRCARLPRRAAEAAAEPEWRRPRRSRSATRSPPAQSRHRGRLHRDRRRLPRSPGPHRRVRGRPCSPARAPPTRHPLTRTWRPSPPAVQTRRWSACPTRVATRKSCSWAAQSQAAPRGSPRHPRYRTCPAGACGPEGASGSESGIERDELRWPPLQDPPPPRPQSRMPPPHRPRPFASRSRRLPPPNRRPVPLHRTDPMVPPRWRHPRCGPCPSTSAGWQSCRGSAAAEAPPIPAAAAWRRPPPRPARNLARSLARTAHPAHWCPATPPARHGTQRGAQPPARNLSSGGRSSPPYTWGRTPHSLRLGCPDCSNRASAGPARTATRRQTWIEEGATHGAERPFCLDFCSTMASARQTGCVPRILQARLSAEGRAAPLVGLQRTTSG
mmetsp:Transcript_29238/g.95390  ORF Transcript_29238/g.95390 Transcript_29238/m.95390 type:complete len:451 (-) Transcript_29238:8-1360(-)